MCIYLQCMLHTVEKLFNVYDGYVFPPEDWLNKIHNFLTVTGMKTKESHGYAVKFFLQNIDLSTSGFDILGTIQMARRVYFQLRQKRYMLVNDAGKLTHFCCIDHLDKGLQQVRTYMCKVQYMVYSMI